MKEKEYVAVFKDHEYILGKFNDGDFCRELDILPQLYKSKRVTKEVLDSISNLGYTENGDKYTIWDKTVYDCIKLTVPVYVEFFGEYTYTGKSYTFDIPSDETIKAATNIYNIVKHTLSDMMRISVNEMFEKKLDESGGIAFVSVDDIPCFIIYQLIELTNRVILWNDRFYTKYVIGDISKIKSSDLNLYVPEEYVGYVIGKGGCNVKDMSKMLGVKKIQVLPLEEKPED